MYNFSTLNDKEFEKLARDILNFHLKLDLQDFKNGRDQGRDLRYSAPGNNNATVVQAKHYLKSGYNKLLKVLVNDELAKVRLLNPQRYIIVTSVELSALNKDTICEKFRPYIQSANEIFGAEDLNKYLEAYPDIETKWYKLWLTSVNIFNKVLHNAILGRSAFVESRISKTIQLYVHSKSYDDAFEILSTYKYILITGQPGVGKTTLAHLLAYYLLSQDHQLIYIDSDIRDAETILSSNPDTKQCFFFDDFLGANYLEIVNPKTTESGFVAFLDRIKNTPNKYLILTTRTSIFKNALERYEKMQRVKVDTARKEIQLGQYSDLDKAQILYNHLYHSELADHQKQEVLRDKNYWQVIRHRNYNPRLIEFITDPYNSTTVPTGGYLSFVLKQLNNPGEVWRYAYEQQFTQEEKLLINAVYSQRHNTDIEETKEMFKAMLDYEIGTNYRPGPNPFNSACRKLLDGILKKEIYVQTGRESISFINPSIKDFLIGYFKANEEERWRVIRGSIFIEQFEQYTRDLLDDVFIRIDIVDEEGTKLAAHILARAKELKSYEELKKENNRQAYLALRTAALLCTIYDIESKTTELISNYCYTCIANYDITELNTEVRDYFITILKHRRYGSELYEYVLSNWEQLIFALLDVCITEDDFERVMSLFDDYDINYKGFLSDKELYRSIQASIERYVDATTYDLISYEEDSVYSEEDWEELKEQVREERVKIFNKFKVQDENYSPRDFFSDGGLGELIKNNIAKKTNRATDTLVNKQAQKEVLKESYEKEIDELFTGEHKPAGSQC